KDTNDYVRKEEVEALIRDLSLTHEGRKTAFGTHELNSDVVVKPKTDTPNVSEKTIALWERLNTGNKLQIPENDYLNLETIIEDLNPTTADKRQKKNAKIIFDVNERVLSDYINVQSIVRDTIGDSKYLNSSEFKAITLNEFFVLGEELDIPLFPTHIEPDSISLDSF